MRARTRIVIPAAVAVVIATCGSARADDLPPKEIFERGAPATVQVLATTGQGLSSGSGAVYDAGKALVFTNAHVIEGSGALKVRIGDGDPVPARLLGSDPCEDLAVLEITTPQDGLKDLEFGESGKVEAGDVVAALGYPRSFADQGTTKVVFTSGVVQSPDVAAAPSLSLPELPSTIQHSATVNPGNSGGPLLNGNAEIVGINSLKQTAASNVEGQFYAISSDHARPVLDRLAAGDSRNNAGWNLISLADPAFTDYFEDPATGEQVLSQLSGKGVEGGMFVLNAATNTPAGKAGFVEGDVITHIKDTPVASMADVCDVLQSAGPAEKLPVAGRYSYNGGTEHPFGERWYTDLILQGKPAA
ncbi:S1C family serine protease [Streptomyces sp. NBC_00239]|uniref:S1C family serine protease n=1 Tax=Streptomyces sp. NBC_00239 TaxID=2903640 RepID=UPI002E27DE8B|nr:S1C family serine protease [Streptomyces sp. NBC_00239]